jgi:hypothetical protein
MLVVGLSNHPADMLDDAPRRRQAAGKRALSRYQDELIQYRDASTYVASGRDQHLAQLEAAVVTLTQGPGRRA